MIFEHKSVLLMETVDSLNVKPDGIYVDGTLGGGGHAYEVSRRLGEKGRLIGIDQDADAIAAATERLLPFKDKVTIVRSNYKNIREVKNSTLKGVRAVYSSFFVWLRDRDRVRRNPMVLVESIKVEKRVKRPFTDTEREQLLRSCATIRDKAMMEFLYSTAVRVSELASLNRDDIRWSSKDLIVYGKGGKERTVYLNERTNMYLQEYLQSRADNNPALFVGLKSPHNRLSKAGIEDMIRRTGERAGVEKAHPHRFRGTSITNAINRGMPLQEASIMAGHAKTETTMLYCSVDQESVKYHHKKYLSA